jgi:hypothetical protein
VRLWQTLRDPSARITYYAKRVALRKKLHRIVGIFTPLVLVARAVFWVKEDMNMARFLRLVSLFACVRGKRLEHIAPGGARTCVHEKDGARAVPHRTL